MKPSLYQKKEIALRKSVGRNDQSFKAQRIDKQDNAARYTNNVMMILERLYLLLIIENIIT